VRKNFYFAVIMLASSNTVFAAQKTDPFDVRVVIAGTCSILAADIDFGVLPEVLGTESKTADVQVKCSNGLPYNISFSATAASSTINGNLLGTGTNTDTIPFRVTMPAVISGTGTGMGATVAARIFTMTGTLPTASAPRADSYKSTQTVYINF
jgi:spore coat protein U-like protein